MEFMFVLIYAAVSVLVYMLDYNEAKKINQKIQDRKKSHAATEAIED
jgi:Na+/melibiose symporter-like transporter